jgi:polar amino acid transport system substrate-binding protein
MKNKCIKVCSFLLIAVYIFSSCMKDKSKDRSLLQIKSRGFFIVGLIDEFPPMSFRGKDNNELIGFDIDLAKETARRLGVKVQFKTSNWNGIISNLNKGDIDVIWAGMSITDERKLNMEFSRPYLANRQIVMVTINSDITKLEMLKDKKIGFQLGSSSEVALSSNLKRIKQFKEIKKFENNTLALADLAAKKVDAVVIDEVSGRWNIAKKPGTFKILNEDMGEEQYVVGFRQNDLTFKETLDKVLDDIKKDKAGEDISKKWFGENILVK